MKFILALLISLTIIGCTKKKDDPLSKVETVQVQLPSIVCGSCSKNIEKAVYAVEGVKAVDVDVEKKSAAITFVSFQTNLNVIERSITESGYDVNGQKRNPEAYEQLDACCKIDG